tara:strand:+ start:2486 stop:2749 length:264 start_codon:yes stop_codon:yes gene_type:complete
MAQQGVILDENHDEKSNDVSTKHLKKWLIIAHNAINNITVINTENENSDTIHLIASSIRNALASLDSIIDDREIAQINAKTEKARKK